ncbi:MAG: response regulator, partial [Syntrophales bacterium]|nr:response regulator [Syntrophales bacterium]
MTAKKIIVVDDEKDIADLVAFHLEKEGFTVTKASDGGKALEMIRRSKPDLVVLDLMLPGMPGLEICRVLRQKAETAQIPIIMLTAKGDQVDRIIGLELGADDYIVKPYELREVLARVRSVLRRLPAAAASVPAP